jgi:hypothetical protein
MSETIINVLLRPLVAFVLLFAAAVVARLIRPLFPKHPITEFLYRQRSVTSGSNKIRSGD